MNDIPKLDLIAMGDAQLDLSIGPVPNLKLKGAIDVRIGDQKTAIFQAEILAGRVAGRRLMVASKFGKSPGGSANNIAFAAAQLGAKAGLVASLGDDHHSQLILGPLKEIGVDVSHVKIHKDGVTGICILIKTERGQRASVYFPGANASLTLHEISDDYLKNARVFCFANYFLLPGVDGERLKGVFKKAKKAGVITLLDPGPVPFSCQEKQINSILPVLEFADFFLPTEDEARIIGKNQDPAEAARFFLDNGAGRVIVKLGAQGCLVVESGGHCHMVESFRLSHVVDTTGAGDVFAAALAVGLLQDEDVVSAVAFANAAAGLACRGQGRETFPSTEQALGLLEAQKGFKEGDDGFVSK